MPSKDCELSGQGIGLHGRAEPAFALKLTFGFKQWRALLQRRVWGIADS